MSQFFSIHPDTNKLELVVDTKLFSQHTIMKAGYMFLDRAYFFFRSEGGNIIVQIHPKEGQSWTAEKFALEYSDELLAMHLREVLERENRTVRETIVKRALGSYADLPNFTTVQYGDNEIQGIDFDKDIDDILREIENDPELKIDEGEISRILAEIEAETESNKSKPLKIDPNKVKNAKAKFQNR